MTCILGKPLCVGIISLSTGSVLCIDLGEMGTSCGVLWRRMIFRVGHNFLCSFLVLIGTYR